MYSTIAYLYQQKCQVILANSTGESFTLRYQPMYTKSIKIHRGIDNIILFEFVNQDQKPVNITGSTFTVRFIDSAGKRTMLVKDMTILHAATGRAKLTLTDTEADSLAGTMISYGIERTIGAITEPVFVDAYADARGTAIVVNSTRPPFVPSKTLAIPDQNRGVKYSDIVIPESTSTTFQYWTTGFEGLIRVQGSTALSGPWYDIDSNVYAIATSGTDYLVAAGTHTHLRLVITTTSGTVDKIIYR